MRLSQQIKQNSLAIISLFVALSALAYNTWRNELSESNRNTRLSGFEIIMHVGELQKIAYLSHFDMDQSKGSPRLGWTEVLLIKDLSQLMPKKIQDKSENLLAVWRDNWQKLADKDELSIAAIDTALLELRTEVLLAMEQLE